MAENQITLLENRIKELESENHLLQEKVDFLTRKLYGRTTEQTSSLGIEGQMSLFDEAEISADPNATEPDLNEVSSYRRNRFRGQKEELLKDIPHEKKLCTLAEEDRFCQECGTPLVSVGEEFVRTEIEFIPAKVRVIDYYRETLERLCRTLQTYIKNYNQTLYPITLERKARLIILLLILLPCKRSPNYQRAVTYYSGENHFIR